MYLESSFGYTFLTIIYKREISSFINFAHSKNAPSTRFQKNMLFDMGRGELGFNYDC